MVSRLIKYSIDRAKRSKFIQNIFEAPIALDKFGKFGEFKDSKGHVYELKSGLRSKIKPGWEHMLKERKLDTSPAHLAKIKQQGEISVEKIMPLLKTMNISLPQSRILEIGCHAGANTYVFAQQGAQEVVGTEFSGYKAASVDEHYVEEQKLNEINEELKRLRDQLSMAFSRKESVRFVDDDICHSRLEKNAFDLICSWDVLEHLHDPEKAFVNMASLLKKEGVMIHQYNSFFSLNGGHSLCTLDFLWGHVRLSEQDFIRYLEEIRPREKERALSFYHQGVNRMTVKALERHCAKAGLEIVSLLPFTKEQHIRMLDHDIYRQSKSNYPNLTLLDLTAPRIMLVAKKSGIA